MKQHQITEIKETLETTNLANIFNVYDEPSLGSNFKTYNISRTLNFVGLDNIAETAYSIYEAKSNDTWALISHKMYGTTRLWWIICKLNNIKDPTQDPETGQQLKILRSDYVKKVLVNIKAS